MLIIEIILTVFAWRKGWKWLSLIPMAVAFFIGFILGAGIVVSGGDVSSTTGLATFLDIFAIISLIIMVVKGPKNIIDTNQDLKQ